MNQDLNSAVNCNISIAQNITGFRDSPKYQLQCLGSVKLQLVETVLDVRITRKLFYYINPQEHRRKYDHKNVGESLPAEKL